MGGAGVQYYLRDANINALPKLEVRPHVKCDMFVPEVYGCALASHMCTPWCQNWWQHIQT